ncbi:MAG: DUF4142 domain-containing protein [Caulobacteraceae bacterium]|nr:DUF4142 domain-containing protein [Caulobacteraceae bacterium]
MNRSLIIVGALALLAACNKAPNADSTAQVPAAPASATPDANPAATIPTPANEAAAPDFVQKAAVGDMFEIQSSKIALDRSTNRDVKDFARMMITGHTKTTAELKAAIKTSGQALTPPAALPDDKQSALDELKKADAKDFDKKYMDAQVDGHQQALDLMARYAKDGDVAAIKDFAAKTGPTVQRHLDTAKAIQGALS